MDQQRCKNGNPFVPNLFIKINKPTYIEFKF